MDLYQMLIQDHREVDSLFEKIEKSGKGASKTREQLFDKLRQELELHTQVEERIVYPDFKKHEGTREFIGEALEEHGEVKKMLQQLSKMEPGEAEWSTRIEELKQAVQHHVRDEEQKIFPAARKEIGKQEADDLARRVQEMKQKASA
ncbi:MAG TPA: hemerythrin domain-containing protein [Stellaceae bacterium]|nr:hemerythrin domain-containing protein [Stellaceae bacterium]